MHYSGGVETYACKWEFLLSGLVEVYTVGTSYTETVELNIEIIALISLNIPALLLPLLIYVAFPEI